MTNIKVNNINYNIPQSWYDINLKTFLRIRKHEENITKMDQIDYNLEFISILTGIPHDDLLDLDPSVIAEIIAPLTSITSKEVDIIEEPIYTIDGITYVLDKKTTKMKLGQFIDLDIINKTGDAWDNGAKITASFMRKALKKSFRLIRKKKKYCSDYKITPYDYEELVKDADVFMEKLPMPYIYTCVVFFCVFKKVSEQHTKDYLSKIGLMN